MITFFQLSTVEEWPTIYGETVADYPWFGAVIIAFIFFTNMLLLNLITGVIVENTLEITRTDEEEQLQQLDEMKLHCLKEFESLLRASDVNENGLLDREELEQLLELYDVSKPKKNAFFLNRAIQSITEERSCAILKWFPTKELLSIFELVEAREALTNPEVFEEGIAISKYHDVIGRSIGVRGGVARAQDHIRGQYEIIGALHQMKRKVLEGCNVASEKIDRHLQDEVSELEICVTSHFNRISNNLERLGDELGNELQVALQDLKKTTLEALPPDVDVCPMGDPEGTEQKGRTSEADPLCVPLSPDDEEALASLESMIDTVASSLFKLVQAFRGEVAFSADLLRDRGPVAMGGVPDGMDLLLPKGNYSLPPSLVVYPTAMPVLCSRLIQPLPKMPP